MGRRAHRKQTGNRNVQHLSRHFERHDGHLRLYHFKQPQRRHENAHRSHIARRHTCYDRGALGHEHGRSL